MTNTPPHLSPTVALRRDYASHGSPVAVLEAPGNVPASHQKSHYDKRGRA